MRHVFFTTETLESVTLTFFFFWQDPEDRTSFIMLQRFPSPEAMSDYQNTESFRAFTDVSGVISSGTTISLRGQGTDKGVVVVTDFGYRWL